METASLLLIYGMTGLFGVVYIIRIRQRQIFPTLSTWFILLVGIGLSFVSYALAENWNLRAGVLNAVDVIVVLAICCAVLLWGKRAARFRPFEKWYLAVAAAIVLYGIAFRDVRGANVYTQMLLSIAYFPTIQNIVSQRRNTESMFCWSCGLIASGAALYHASAVGNTLSVLYALRATIFVSVTLGLTLYYRRKMAGAHAP